MCHLLQEKILCPAVSVTLEQYIQSDLLWWWQSKRAYCFPTSCGYLLQARQGLTHENVSLLLRAKIALTCNQTIAFMPGCIRLCTKPKAVSGECSRVAIFKWFFTRYRHFLPSQEAPGGSWHCCNSSPPFCVADTSSFVWNSNRNTASFQTQTYFFYCQAIIF